MSSPKPPPPEPYKVSYSRHVRDELRTLLERAKAAGHGKEYLEAAREIASRLRIYPQFGEPLLDLTYQRGTMWISTIGPLVVRYAIYEDRRVVVVATPIMDARGSVS
jgi:hypothetical protein